MLNIALMDFDFPIDEKNIAVAVSGGGDSMALAHMITQWAKDKDIQIHLLTVNHNLRPEALNEAVLVGNHVKNFPNSCHQILTWDYQSKPTTAIMESARTARYELMTEYCVKNNISILCVGHHGDDQLETFLFRLAKGSGLDGLKSMSTWTDFQGIKIYRPLLAQTHEELLQYCTNNQIEWVEDPSNHNDKYARPRLRKALTTEGFDAKRFTITLQRLSRAHDALSWLCDDVFKKCQIDYSHYNWGMVLDYPLDIQIRVLQKMIIEIGHSDSNHPPKLERIEDIIATLRPLKSATLHGCLITLGKNGKTLEIKRSSP